MAQTFKSAGLLKKARGGSSRFVWTLWRNHQRHFLLFLISCSLVLTYHIQQALFRPRLEHLVFYETEELGERDPEVSCLYPINHPFDPSILSHIRPARPVRCSSWSKLYLQVDESGRLAWNQTALREDGYPPDGSGLYCNYQQIRRPRLDDFRVDFDPPQEFLGRPVKLTSDFVFVECTNWLGLSKYKDYLARVQKLPGIRKYKEGELDVLVIGLDSVSKLNFMRQLPKAYRLLTKELDATVLIGFNKVGRNTFPNVVPMLTGRPLIPQPQTNFKEWPFLWKDYSKAGAVTLYAEDQPQINMFDYLAEGIDEQPTDHYMHTFWLAADHSLERARSSRFCLGPRPIYDLYFSYLKSFIQTYSQEPKFLFSLLNEPSHNFLNSVGVIDEVLTEFLNSSYQEGLLNRSALVVLGDHGNRMDTIRSTELGKIEDSMPMVTILLPDWVNSTWRSSLKKNRNRLTSTYDLYATFVQILGTLGGSPGPPGTSDPRVWEHFSQPARGQSLFSEVPKTRSCEEAGVPDWHCVCRQEEQHLPLDQPVVVKAADSVVSYINHLLREFPSCAHLWLDRVSRAVRKENKDIVHLSLEVRPSGALFEATLDISTDFYEVTDLQRINPYGSQASCLGEELLRNNSLYKSTCYCKSFFRFN